MTKMDKKTVSEAVVPELEKMGCFLVDVTVSKANDIEIVIEKESGTVDMDDCAAVDRFIHSVFSQDEEDYSLTVSSAGLDRPFKVLRQFEKAVGTRATVSFKGGRRVLATIESVTPETLTINVGGVSETVPFDTITTVIPYIEFE